MRLLLAVGITCGAALLGAVEARGAAGIEDAEALALELSGELLAPPELTAQIGPHLALIRATNYVLDSVTVSLDWVPGQLLVGLTPEALQEFLDGTYAGLDSLNAEYGPVVMLRIGSTAFLQLVFEANYNPELLVPVYEAAPGVTNAEPNWCFYSGGERPDIIAEALGTYTFEYAWNCDLECHSLYSWTYQVLESGQVIVVDQGGDAPPAVSVEIPTSGNVDFAVRAWPNPTRGATQFAFASPTSGHVSVTVHDVRGRLVRRIAEEEVSAGRYVRYWDGTGEGSRLVPAGVYFLQVRFDADERVTTRLVMLR